MRILLAKKPRKIINSGTGLLVSVPASAGFSEGEKVKHYFRAAGKTRVSYEYYILPLQGPLAIVPRGVHEVPGAEYKIRRIGRGLAATIPMHGPFESGDMVAIWKDGVAMVLTLVSRAI